MKTILLTLSLAMAGAGSARAQVFQPAATSGAVLGAIAGGLIGGHNHDRWGEGMAIGAVAGAVLGSVIAPQQPVYQSAAVYQTTPPPVVYGQQVPVAPTVSSAPTIIQQAAPQVVYVESAPRVVYVDPQPRVIYMAPPPVVSFGFGVYSGPRYHGGPVYRYGYGRRGHR